MGRDKKIDPTTEHNSQDKITQNIIKEYGDGVLISGKHLIDNPSPTLSWSPSLDLALGGGVSCGGIIILTSRPKLGKTASFLTLARNAQKIGYNIYILDIESRLKPRDLCVRDFDHKNINIIKSTSNKILCDKDFLKIATEILFTTTKSFILIDSVSQLANVSRMGADISEQQRAPEARVLSAFLRETSMIIPANKHIVGMVTHQVANLSNNTRSLFYETSGNKLQYLAETKLRGISSESFPKGNTDKSLGMLIKWQVSYSALGPPGRTCESYFRFGYGLDEVLENIDIGLNIGLVKQSASWYEYDDVRAQGIEKFRAALNEAPEKLSELKEKINAMLL